MLGLALSAHRAVGELERRDLRDDGPPEPLRDRRPEHGAVAVVRGLAEEDEIGALALERPRERRGGPEEIGSGRSVVADQHRAVGAHRERLAQRVHRLRRPERDEDDLAALRLLQAQRLLDRVEIRGVERRLPRAIEPLRRGVHPLVDGRVRHLLHADGDLHRAGLYRRHPRALPPNRAQRSASVGPPRAPERTLV